MTKANELVLGETTTDVSSITYTVNPIGQRTHATRTGAATNGTEWGYGTLGQLETADDTNPAADRAYQYDSIGNRLFSEISNTQISNPPQATTTAYAPNLLNQYGNITTGNTSFTPSHDDDGNQKNAQIQPLGSSSLASCVYHWDAENRLTSVTTPGGEPLVSYLYDAQSRLISRSVGVSPTTATAYIHDGWNRIAEYTVTPGNPNATPPTEPVANLSKTYLWGLDLSASFQGAGGVGGLLSVNTIGGSVHYPTYDGNGNITEYLTAAGAVAAHFEYDPFGNAVASTDTTNQFEYRFSTKPVAASTGLFYYGYRWYDPLTGKWPSRDPIEEEGGLNLYGFVGNDGVDWVDDSGLFWAGGGVLIKDGKVVSDSTGAAMPDPNQSGIISEAYDQYKKGKFPKEVYDEIVKRRERGSYGGHPDFENSKKCCKSGDFDWTYEDRDGHKASSKSPLGKGRHFQQVNKQVPKTKEEAIKIAERDVETAIFGGDGPFSEKEGDSNRIPCDAMQFQQAMHGLQDFYAHFNRGYKNGHDTDLIAFLGAAPFEGSRESFIDSKGRKWQFHPDLTNKSAFDEANSATKKWLEIWHRNCKCVKKYGNTGDADIIRGGWTKK